MHSQNGWRHSEKGMEKVNNDNHHTLMAVLFWIITTTGLLWAWWTVEKYEKKLSKKQSKDKENKV